MDVRQVLNGQYLTVTDPSKHRGVLLSRETVKQILESEEFFTNKILKMMKNKESEEEIMRELPDGIVLRIGQYKEQLRVDIRETTVKPSGITYLKSGVNLSVLYFLEMIRQLRSVYDSTSQKSDISEAVDEEEDDASEPPPSKKAKVSQTLSKTHHGKDSRPAKSFRKGVKAAKKKATVVSSDEESN